MSVFVYIAGAAAVDVNARFKQTRDAYPTASADTFSQYAQYIRLRLLIVIKCFLYLENFCVKYCYSLNGVL